jgi:hypothetical protein
LDFLHINYDEVAFSRKKRVETFCILHRVVSPIAYNKETMFLHGHTSLMSQRRIEKLLIAREADSESRFGIPTVEVSLIFRTMNSCSPVRLHKSLRKVKEYLKV